MKSQPRVFIVESLRFSDEKRDLFEGKFISQILTLSGSPSEYVYLRTRKELEEVLDQFEQSQHRYLHFSCHGNSREIGLTLDDISFEGLGQLLAPYIENRRVFFSSCEVMNENLARALLKDTGCYSVVGPHKSIDFDRAAIYWASFYHLMLRDGAESMNRDNIQKSAAGLQKLFGVHMRYFSHAKHRSEGFKEVKL